MSAPPFALLETTRWAGEVALLDRHLARLRASAAHFGFRCDEATVLAALEGATDGLDPAAPHRFRLTVERDGRAEVEAVSIDANPPIRTAAVFPEPVQPGGPFWRHKTTRRAHYDGPLAWARARGFDEAVLADERGEVVEATRATVWVQKGGRLLTPPLSAGGLPGVFRAHVLATHPDAAETRLTTRDLFEAEAVLLSNAVRGLFPVEVREAGA